MGLCVWTAVHLNVPELEREGTKKYLFPRQTWRKVKWLLMGLFAPELVSWTAFVQRREAKEFHRRIKALLGEDQSYKKKWLARRGSKTKMNGQGTRDEEQRLEEGCETDPPNDTSDNSRSRRRNTWTVTHSYYATMGGFAFSNQSPRGEFATPDGWKRLTLTSLGILELVRLKPELLPDLSVADIQDKSKANGLAKAIVIMQASWFMIQCLSRMVTGMTISVLELNTFAHALCALIAYAMWWHKPLDVSQPTLIEGPGTDHICASMYRRTVEWPYDNGAEVKAFNESGENLFAEMVVDAPKEFEESILPITNEWVMQLSSKDDEPLRVLASAPSGFYKPLHCPRRNGQKSSNEMLLPGIVSQSNCDAIFRLYYGQAIFGMEINREGASPSSMASKLRWHVRTERTGVFVELSPAQLLLCQLGSNPVIHGLPSSQSYVTNRVKTISTSGDGHCADYTTAATTVGLFIAGSTYGGIHLMAWKPPVKSNTEIIIWRLSAIFIMVFGCGTWLIWMLRRTWRTLPKEKVFVRWVDHTVALLRSRFVDRITDTAAFGATVIYILARIYLVVECFVGVPRLPDSVFEAPAWAQYFPHFG